MIDRRGSTYGHHETVSPMRLYTPNPQLFEQEIAPNQVLLLQELSKQLASQVEKLQSSVQQKRLFSEHIHNLQHQLDMHDEMAQVSTLKTMHDTLQFPPRTHSARSSSNDQQVIEQMQQLFTSMMKQFVVQQKTNAVRNDEEWNEDRKRKKDKKRRKKRSKKDKDDGNEWDDDYESDEEFPKREQYNIEIPNMMDEDYPDESFDDYDGGTWKKKKKKTKESNFIPIESQSNIVSPSNSALQEDLELNRLVEKAKMDIAELNQTPRWEPVQRSFSMELLGMQQAKRLPVFVRKMRTVYHIVRFLRMIRQIHNAKQYRIQETIGKMQDFISHASVNCFDNMLQYIHIPITSIINEQGKNIDHFLFTDNNAGLGLLANIFSRSKNITPDSMPAKYQKQVFRVCAKVKALLDGVSSMFTKTNLMIKKNGSHRTKKFNSKIVPTIQFCCVLIHDYICYPADYLLPSELALLEFDNNGATVHMSKQRTRIMLGHFIITRILLCKVLTPRSENEKSQRNSMSIAYGKNCTKILRLIRSIIFYALELALRPTSLDEDEVKRNSSSSSQKRRLDSKEVLNDVDSIVYYLQQQMSLRVEAPHCKYSSNHYLVGVYSDPKTVKRIVEVVGVHCMLQYESIIRNIIIRAFNATVNYQKYDATELPPEQSLHVWVQYRRALRKEKMQRLRHVAVVRQQLDKLEEAKALQAKKLRLLGVDVQ